MHNKVEALEWISDSGGLLEKIEMKGCDFFAAGQKDIVFTREYIVDQTRADTCGAGNVRHGCAMKTFATEKIPRCVNNFRAASVANRFCSQCALPFFLARQAR